MPLAPSDSIDLLHHLVSIPSLSGREAEAAGWLAGWLAGHGFQAGLDAAGNAVGVRGDGPRRVVLLGHIDTFPGELPVRREEDWLHGRGAVDAKGPLAAFAAAAARVAVPPGWQVWVVGAVEEEAATSRGARHLLADPDRPAPEACVIGEPGGWDRVAVGYKGRLLLDVRLRAPFAHSAGPAPLPAEQAVDLWNAVAAYCADFNAGRDKAFERLEPALRHVETRDEGAYGTARLSMAFRLPPGLAPQDLAGELAPVLNGPDDVQFEFSGAEPAFRAGKNTPLVRAFLAAIRQQGGQARFVLKTGTSDMNVVGPAWGCPMCAYGPGDSKLDHTPEERISLSEYLRAIEVLEGMLANLLDLDDGVRNDTG
jgi:LysW-gamma-L-lysine carboxypeptidase